MATQSIKVSVYGNELNLRADSPERVLRAAAHVDSQMTLFHAKAPDQSTATLALLTALNAAEQSAITVDGLRACRNRVESLAALLEAAAVE